jgi:hypothetical protein
MSHLSTIGLDDQIGLDDRTDHGDAYDPTPEDEAAYAAWMAATEAEGHDQDVPTPDDVLDDERPDLGRWWEWMTDAELDQRWALTIGGGRASAMDIGPNEEARLYGGC